MSRIFLYGDWRANAGPSNVNRSFIQNCDDDLIYLKFTNKLLKAFEFLFKVLISRIIIVSGSGLVGSRFNLIRMLHKKVVYIKHGDVGFENVINNLNLSNESIEAHYNAMKYASKIVCVSKKYMNWVENRYPEFKNKLTYVNNGLEISPRPKCDKIPFSIAVSGGNRNIKNNSTVCKAASLLNEAGYNCKVYVFGRTYSDNENLDVYPCVEFTGHLDKKEYYEKLDQIQLFVVDSIVEPFGLVLGDALNCRCSLLISDNVGAGGILDLQQCDTVYNPTDTDEVMDKMKYLFNNSNADRLLNSVDIEECSGRHSYLRLKEICKECI